MSQAVDLTNCDREPIHIPGSVQPHGVLLAFDGQGILKARSANAAEIPALDAPLGIDSNSFPDAAVREVIAEALNGPVELEARTVMIDGAAWDLTVSQSEEFRVLEFEPQPSDAPSPATFAMEAQRALTAIQSAKSVDELVAIATKQVRQLTGFDRVMCYRFRYDDSGSVVAEEKSDDLEPFLGLRYPATDIPAQARRLYVLNPLRFIADVHATPSPIEPPMGRESGRPLDLSHACLRSVSPIHVEYLRNMGVQASMSISIIVDGKLWGLFACHHYRSAKWAPQAVRVSCRLLSQIVSVLVERHVARERLEGVEASRELREKVIEDLRNGEDILGSLVRSQALAEVIESDGMAVVFEGRVATERAHLSPAAIRSLVDRWSAESASDIRSTGSLGADADNGVAGVLAIRFSQEQDGWVLWFRQEEIEHVRWAGNPEKTYDEGPNGPRLSPRGSFAEYAEAVRGTAQPWTDTELETAARLRVGLQSVALARLAEIERARDILVASLSHDLRNPLHAIDLSAQLLSMDSAHGARVAPTIASSSNRMMRLIDHMLDFSRIQAGLSLGVAPTDTDADALTRQIILETQTAYPGLVVEVDSQLDGWAHIDPDRYAQVLSNLLSNARHHGDILRPVQVELRGGGSNALSLVVRNHGTEISEDIREGLFRPYKLTSTKKESNRRGLGLGLFIVKQVVDEHGGSVELEPYLGTVSFRVGFPPRMS